MGEAKAALPAISSAVEKRLNNIEVEGYSSGDLYISQSSNRWSGNWTFLSLKLSAFA